MKKLISIILIIMLLVSSCVGDNDFMEGGEENYDFKITAIKKSKRVRIKEPEALLEILEQTLVNCFSCNCLLTEDTIEEAKTSGLFIKVEYKNEKELFHDYDRKAYPVNEVMFLIFDDGRSYAELTVGKGALGRMEMGDADACEKVYEWFD